MENDMRKTAIESNPALEKSVKDMARGRMLTPQERTRKAVLQPETDGPLRILKLRIINDSGGRHE